MHSKALKDKSHNYKPGEIVIVETEDIRFGHVRIPAIVRYYAPETDHYEVNAFVVSDGRSIDTRDVHQWCVRPYEITLSMGMATVENPYQAEPDTYTPFVDIAGIFMKKGHTDDN